jgi:hypothetical protein
MDKWNCALLPAPAFSLGAFPGKIRKFHGLEVPDFSPQRAQRTPEEQPGSLDRMNRMDQDLQNWNVGMLEAWNAGVPIL